MYEATAVLGESITHEALRYIREVEETDLDRLDPDSRGFHERYAEWARGILGKYPANVLLFDHERRYHRRRP